MKIGDFVFNNHHEILRFGTIIGKTVEPNGWAFFTVSWHNDERYVHAIAYINKLRNTDYKKTLWRSDELTPADPSRLINSTQQHYEFKSAST